MAIKGIPWHDTPRHLKAESSNFIRIDVPGPDYDMCSIMCLVCDTTLPIRLTHEEFGSIFTQVEIDHVNNEEHRERVTLAKLGGEGGGDW